MGIKGALARCVVGLSLAAAAAPASAQDDSDNVASTRAPEDRADARDAADPSELDRGFADDSRAQDSDSDDNSNVDRDGVDKDQGDDEGAPKPDRGAAKKDKDAAAKDVAKKEPAKKEPAKKDADKSDKARSGAAAKAQQRPGGCVDVSSEARYAGVGYDHLVTLKSDCKKPMQCVVRTDVNPEPTKLMLAPHAEESVIMWRGSPSRAFTPDVTCQ